MHRGPDIDRMNVDRALNASKIDKDELNRNSRKPGEISNTIIERKPSMWKKLLQFFKGKKRK